MNFWHNEIDPGTIPDAVIASEHAKRMRARRKTYTGAGGRPPILIRCEKCGVEGATRSMRRHKCAQEAQPK